MFYLTPFALVSFRNTHFLIILLILVMSFLNSFASNVFVISLLTRVTRHGVFTSVLALSFSLPWLSLYWGQKVSSTSQLSFCSCLISCTKQEHKRESGVFMCTATLLSCPSPSPVLDTPGRKAGGLDVNPLVTRRELSQITALSVGSHSFSRDAKRVRNHGHSLQG